MILFVYFDMGGVALLDFSGTKKWDELQKDLGVTEKNKVAFSNVWAKTREQICIDCDIDTLLPVFTKETGLEFPNGYSMLQDFVNRFEVNPSVWPVIDQVHKVCKIGLLTNAYPRMLNAVQKRGILPPVTWDVIVDSSVVGYQKPDQRMFEIAESKSLTPKESILFIDNSEEHIEAAQKFGWRTFLYDSTSPWESSLKLSEYFDQVI